MSDRPQQVRRVLIVTLVLNALVAIAKVLVGHHFNIVSLVADGVHSSLDALNNVAGLVAMHLAHQPPDEEHPYGHKKFETVATLGIGISLGIMGAGLVREALDRLGSTSVAESHPATFAVATGTLLINFLVARYEERKGRELESDFLLADASHTRSDVFVTSTVLIALVAVRLDFPMLDLLAALTIAGFIGWVAYRLISKNLQVLADAAVLDPAAVIALVRSVDGVRSCHRVRSRGSEGFVFVDLHVQVDPAMPTDQSHALGHAVVALLKSRMAGIAEVLVHVEPFDPARHR